MPVSNPTSTVPPTPASRLIPLATVTFNQATSIVGSSIMLTTLTAMETRLVGGVAFVCPQPYLDPSARVIVIEDREYPMERVHFYIRAKMAKSKPEAPEDLSRYSIGPKRIVVTMEPKDKRK